MISCNLINESDNSSGCISGIFGLPGLATWVALPDQPKSNYKAWYSSMLPAQMIRARYYVLPKR